MSLLFEKGDAAHYDLSIVIPCFLENEKLANTLASIEVALRQVPTNLKVEVILIDNNSPISELLVQLVQSYQDRLDIVFVMQPKLQHSFSLASARNRGVLGARGKWILFTDADCMIDGNFFAVLTPALQGAETKIYTGERVFVQIPETITANDLYGDFFDRLDRVPSASNYGLIKDRRFPWLEQLPNQEHPWNFVHGCFFLCSARSYLKVGGSDTAYDGHWGYEDIDLAYRLCRDLEAEIHYLKDAKVYHQEFAADLEKIATNQHRQNKSQNPNYQRICRMIDGFDTFKKRQLEAKQIITN
jgi:glycosyltransferase involved in cell wall biosynthesis